MTIAATDSGLLNSYVAPTKTDTTTKPGSSTALNADFNTFLKILTAQLANQDPTAPVDPSEFTNQLVMYSQVEQQMSTNSKLDNVLSTMNSNGITPLLSYVGQYVESSTDGKLVVQNGQALLAYDLPSKAQTVAISVQDSKGKVIATVDGAANKGMNRVAWDGKLDSGEVAKDGVYKFVLTAKDSSGNLIKTTDMRTIGQVTSLETDSDGSIRLMVGALEVKDTAIKSIFGAVASKDNTSTGTTT